MRRREFITLVGGAAAAWPIAARGQQRERVRRIGVLSPFAADDAEGNARITAFAQALAQLGWTFGQNVRIDYRWGPGTAETMRKYAAELVALASDVILASTSAAVAPLVETNRAVPIVFAAVADPVAAGYVESLARLGGNTAGFTAFAISAKWLELIKDIALSVTRAICGIPPQPPGLLTSDGRLAGTVAENPQMEALGQERACSANPT
jgi:putative ABC transport system substrate-binding protein